MAFVIDASVVSSWYFANEQTPEAEHVLDAAASHRFLVPTIWWFEVRNVLLVGERRSRATLLQTERFLAGLLRLPVDTASPPDGGDVFALARRHRLTFYDAAYLELALREQIALATLDGDLAKAAKAEGVPLAITR